MYIFPKIMFNLSEMSENLPKPNGDAFPLM